MELIFFSLLSFFIGTHVADGDSTYKGYDDVYVCIEEHVQDEDTRTNWMSARNAAWNKHVVKKCNEYKGVY